jgi:hypothetical protein
VQDVRINASLYHRWGQVDPFGGEDLNQRLVDDPPAVIAAGGTRTGKVLRLIDIYLDIYANPLGHNQKEVAEKGTRRAAPDHPYARAIVQRQR